MTHPAPNSELTAESVKLLKAGDVLRHPDGRTGFYQSGTVGITVRSVYNGQWVFWPIEDQVTFIGRPDADGWIPHDGGPNPVPGCVVDVRWDDGETWTDTPPEPALKWENITHFRLAAPSVERDQGSFADAHTHRATDGLSGKLDRLQGASERMAEARAKLTPHTSSWPQMDRATNDFHNALNALDHDDCLKLIEAARASQVGMSEANEPKPDVAGARERLFERLAEIDLQDGNTPSKRATYSPLYVAHPTEPAARDGGEADYFAARNRLLERAEREGWTLAEYAEALAAGREK